MENKLTLEEELYCLKYEFDTLAEYVIKNQAERWVPNCIDQLTESEHLERYRYACLFAQGKNVLDIAGGSGYGTYLLSKNGKAKEVHSVDIDANAVRYANSKYYNKSITREVGDAISYVKDNYYELIVSFETIEHLTDYDSFLKNIHKSLKVGGELIISSPSVLETTLVNNNKYHTIEWSFLDFQNLLKDKFKIKEIYVQSVSLKKDYKNNIFSRFKRKLLNEPPISIKRPVFEKYEGQYKPNEIVRCYQLIHCVKR